MSGGLALILPGDRRNFLCPGTFKCASATVPKMAVFFLLGRARRKREKESQSKFIYFLTPND